MQTLRHTAIVTKAADYKEYDKLIRLFTVDGGIITAAVKGVKKPNAKLKPAAQPFAFCEFVLTQNNGFNTVTGASPIESLFALTYDPLRFIAASIMLEAADIAVSSMPAPALFVYLLKVFRAVLYQNKDPFAAAALFIARALQHAGYGEVSGIPKAQTPETLPEISPEEHTAAKLLKKAAALFEQYLQQKLNSALLL
ncbi:MAG: DNA repair protein RecO [Firmicutes bacterium]|nr:DNA repair protein RecO [Bacillota bacterium]